LRHLSSDPSQALDIHIIDDLRNFLVDPPDGMDLAAINIERGRDLGLGTLNETRVALGFKAYTSFDQLTSDPATAANFAQAYGTIDKVDLWAGGLAEDHAPGAFVGETFQKIIADQFEALRDGDRLWFQNQGFDAQTLKEIESTTLSDLILRDTDTTDVQSDAFVFVERHSGTAAGVTGDHPDAPQLVIGSDGTDTLVGGPLADILVAGKGQDTMTGLAGNDDFRFDGLGHRALITDFQPGHDKLEFDGVGRKGFGDVDIRLEHGHAVVHFAGNEIELADVLPKQLHAGDFIFQA
jgi:peroxidase